MEDKELEKSSIGGVVMSRRSNHSTEEKIRIAETCLSGKMGICEAGRQAGVTHKTIIRWINRYKSEGPSAFLPSEHIQKKRVVTTNCQKSAEAIVPGKKPGRAEQSLVREKDRRRSMR